MNFNFHFLIKAVGIILIITGLAMIPPIICSLYYKEDATFAGLLGSCLLSVLSGIAAVKLTKKKSRSLRVRDGYLIVITCWVVCSLIGAFPYYLSGQVPNFVDGIFEAVAGYTTTGATVISEYKLSHSLMMLKAMTHWLGGMGILVFLISILPALGIGGQRIAAAETPGPAITKWAPKFSQVAKNLYIIYISLTVLAFALLWIGSDMSAFEALINSMGCISTAGLFLHPEGVAFYNSIFVEMVISFFSMAASISFVIYIYLIHGNIRAILKTVELRIFLAIIAISVIIISTVLTFSETYDSFFMALRHAFFQVVSFCSTSGFTIGEYSKWPTVCKFILLILLFIGGCAASTSGGIKVIRIIIMLKLIARGFFKKIHPRSISAIKVGGNTISAPMASSITTFILLYIGTFFVASLVLSLQGLDLETTLSATLALMSTTGIGFGDVGDSGNFAVFTGPLRLFMSFIMIVGRLELFTVFLLFFPSFWNSNKASSI